MILRRKKGEKEKEREWEVVLSLWSPQTRDQKRRRDGLPLVMTPPLPSPPTPWTPSHSTTSLQGEERQLRTLSPCRELSGGPVWDWAGRRPEASELSSVELGERERKSGEE